MKLIYGHNNVKMGNSMGDQGKYISLFHILASKILQQVYLITDLSYQIHINQIHTSQNNVTTEGDKESEYLSICKSTQTLRKIKVVICNHQADSPFHLWPDV